MIGVIGNVARTVLPQIARQFGRQAVQRIIQGEAIENVVSRGELEQLAKSTGKMAFSELMKQGKDALMNDYEKKNTDWNARMNNFTRNLNSHFKQHRTLYAEERNVANKNKIEDRHGLWNAYASPSGLYKSNNTLYVSGTGGKDGGLENDIMSDLFLIPTHTVRFSEKAQDVQKELKQSPEVTRLVGHSLASAVINDIDRRNPDKYNTTTYATPAFFNRRKGKNPKHLNYRNKGDWISMFDRGAQVSDLDELNPIVAHSYKNFEGNGLYNINAGTNISNGIRPNN